VSRQGNPPGRATHRASWAHSFRDPVCWPGESTTSLRHRIPWNPSRGTSFPNPCMNFRELHWGG